MEKKTYTYISDPGHGWLAVPLSELDELNFVPTPYSYHNNTTAYLEEDCDMPAFLDTATDFTIENTHINHSAGIRNLPHFNTPDGTSTYDKLRAAREVQ